MNTYYYVLLTIFCILAYMIVVDKNVATYITLLLKLSSINLKRFYFMVKFHPRNFITTWMLNRKIRKEFKNFEKDFE